VARQAASKEPAGQVSFCSEGEESVDSTLSILSILSKSFPVKRAGVGSRQQTMEVHIDMATRKGNTHDPQSSQSAEKRKCTKRCISTSPPPFPQEYSSFALSLFFVRRLPISNLLQLATKDQKALEGSFWRMPSHRFVISGLPVEGTLVLRRKRGWRRIFVWLFQGSVLIFFLRENE